MFDYLSAENRPSEPEGAVVFGRHDSRLVDGMSSLSTDGLAKYFIISGWLGKDSGYLRDLKLPEADYLAAVATGAPYNIPPEMIYRETKALNGGDNARYSLDMIDEHNLPRYSLTALAHATSLRRLAATLEFEGAKKTKPTTMVHRVATDYPFDATNTLDQIEAAAEFMRLVEWPAKGWLGPQEDLPQDLIEFAAANSQKVPKPPAAAASQVLNKFPPKARLTVMDWAARRYNRH